MKNNKTQACRANSLPAEGKGGTRKKLRARVSFSSLPPTEIAVRNVVQPECHLSRSANADSGEELPSNPDHGIDKKSIHRKHSFDSKKLNMIDSANEMLMDFLEEIEAESVTIEDCLRDAVNLRILDHSDARLVLPDFCTSAGGLDTCRESFGGTTHPAKETPAEYQDAVEKFFDLYSTLSAEELSKCYDYTLGKLCQLTPFKDYQNIQTRAASTRSSSLQGDGSLKDGSQTFSDDCFCTSESMDESTSTDVSCLSSDSSETFDHSTGDFDGEFLHKTGNRIREREKYDIKHILPSLMDDGILAPRQVWAILESENREQTLKKLLTGISKSKEHIFIENLANKFNELIWFNENKANLETQSKACNPTDHKSVYGNGGFFDDALNITQLSCKESCPDEHTPGENVLKTHHRKKETSLVKLNVARRFSSEQSDDNSLSITKNQRIVPLSSSHHSLLPTFFTEKKHPENGKSRGEKGFIESWCNVNNLHDSTTTVLQSRGITTEENLTSVTADDITILPGLSWSQKTELLVAIEALRLDHAYLRAHEKLSNCKRLLDSSLF